MNAARTLASLLLLSLLACGDAVAAEADDDRITIRLVDVIPTADGFTYEQQLIEESTRRE